MNTDCQQVERLQILRAPRRLCFSVMVRLPVALTRGPSLFALFPSSSLLCSHIISLQGFANSSLEDVLGVRVSCLPHHSFASDQYQVEVGKLKLRVMEGEAETPAAEVAQLLQQVCGVT